MASYVDIDIRFVDVFNLTCAHPPQITVEHPRCRHRHPISSCLGQRVYPRSTPAHTHTPDPNFPPCPNALPPPLLGTIVDQQLPKTVRHIVSELNEVFCYLLEDLDEFTSDECPLAAKIWTCISKHKASLLAICPTLPADDILQFKKGEFGYERIE